MKHIVLTLLTLATHTPLFSMDKSPQLADKAVDQIAQCTKKCFADHPRSIWKPDGWTYAQCTDICKTVYQCKVKEKLHKEHTQVILAQMQAQQTTPPRKSVTFER